MMPISSGRMNFWLHLQPNPLPVRSAPDQIDSIASLLQLAERSGLVTLAEIYSAVNALMDGRTQSTKEAA